MTKEEEKGLAIFFDRRIEIYLEDLCQKTIERKVNELFGPDTYAHINHLLETKQDLDPAKIKALRDYIIEVSILFRKAYHTIKSTNATSETQKIDAIQSCAVRMVNIVEPDEVDHFLESEKGQRTIINIVQKNKEKVEKNIGGQPCNESTSTKS